MPPGTAGYLVKYWPRPGLHSPSEISPQPDLVEVHGRAQVARYICQKRPDLPVVLYLHNDPREMKGARNISERVWLMTHLAGIICVSEHIKQCFLDGLSAAAVDEAKICAVLNGTTRHLWRTAAQTEPHSDHWPDGP